MSKLSRISPPRLTYANVMSTVAVLAVLMTGVAVGHHAPNNTGTSALKKGAVTTAKIRDAAVKPPKLASGLRPRWARVSSDGQLLAGRGVVNVRSGGGNPDQWVVEFAHFSFEKCAAFANVMGTSTKRAAPNAAGKNEVLVNIVDASGTTSSAGFGVQVACRK